MTGVPPGRYSPWVRTQDGRTLVARDFARVDVAEGDEIVSVSIEPVPAGFVRIPPGSAAAKSTVAFRDREGKLAAVRKGGGGVYLPAGKYEATIEGETTRTVTIEVVESRSVNLEDSR